MAYIIFKKAYGIINRLNVWILYVFFGRRKICSIEQIRDYVANVPNPKILVIKLDGVGDVIMLSPFLKGLAQRWPTATVDIVVDEALKEYMEQCPYVRRVFGVKGKIARFERLVLSPIKAWLIARGVIKDRHYDIGFIPRFDADESFATYLSLFCNVRGCVAFSEKVTTKRMWQNAGFDHLVSAVKADSQRRNLVELNMELLKPFGWSDKVGGLQLWSNARDEENALELLNQRRNREHMLTIAVCPSSAQRSKEWPLERYSEVISELRKRFSLSIVLIGGSGRSDIEDWAKRIVSPSDVNLLGRTTLLQSGSVLAWCNLYIGSDTAAVHLAAAVGTPVVVISKIPVSLSCDEIDRFSPWRVRQRTVRPASSKFPCVDLCLNANPHCILEVSVRDVVQATISLIEEISSLKESSV